MATVTQPGMPTAVTTHTHACFRIEFPRVWRRVHSSASLQSPTRWTMDQQQKERRAKTAKGVSQKTLRSNRSQQGPQPHHTERERGATRAGARSQKAEAKPPRVRGLEGISEAPAVKASSQLPTPTLPERSNPPPRCCWHSEAAGRQSKPRRRRVRRLPRCVAPGRPPPHRAGPHRTALRRPKAGP